MESLRVRGQNGTFLFKTNITLPSRSPTFTSFSTLSSIFSWSFGRKFWLIDWSACWIFLKFWKFQNFLSVLVHNKKYWSYICCCMFGVWTARDWVVLFWVSPKIGCLLFKFYEHRFSESIVGNLLIQKENGVLMFCICWSEKLSFDVEIGIFSIQVI